MRRKEKQFSSKNIITRNSSHQHFTCSQTRTLAEINGVSARNRPPRLSPSCPLRITLPDYFNIPRFQDVALSNNEPPSHQKLIQKIKGHTEVRSKVKQLQVLAEGMRRAKNIKEESRYYFTEGVILHNAGIYEQSIAAFEKFLKIVLFLRDEKSVELALNAIGAQFMYLGDYSHALHYHVQQAEGPRPDLALSHTNQGLCYELDGNYPLALQHYQLALTHCQLPINPEQKQGRIVLLKQLIGRVEGHIDSPFLTDQPKEVSKEGVLLKRISNSPQKGCQDFRCSQAILKADSSMVDYLTSMRNSFIKEEQ